MSTEDRVAAIEQLECHLSRENCLIKSVEAIPKAKVPIVKFVMQDPDNNNSSVEGDISVHGTLVSMRTFHRM